MAEYADFSGNPYLAMLQQEPAAPDWRMILANSLTGIGSGISAAGASGRNWTSGIAPGLSVGLQYMGQQQRQAEQDKLRRMTLGMHMADFEDKRAERARKLRGIEQAAAEFAPGQGGTPGMNLRPPAVRMGPDSYDTRTAGLEGGQKNGGMIFNELGSGAFGPYQFMPGTWADVRTKNADLNLPADMTQATREQHDAAHQRFKAGNAQILQQAGIEPTPANLYLAHRFGAGGATTMLKANPDALLADTLPREWQAQNPDMRGQTVAGFKRLADERMRGVGVPYQANGETTQYAMQPKALPSFDDPMLSLQPRGNSRFMPGVIPNADQDPGFNAPVMPQPQAQPNVIQAQYTPPGAPAAPPPSSADRPPPLPLVPKPQLPEAEAVRIRRLLLAGAITPEQAQAQKEKITGDLWTTQKDQARDQHAIDLDIWKHNRGQADKDAWTPLDDKNAAMKLGKAYDGKAYQLNTKTGEIKPVAGAQVQIDMGGKAVTEIAKQRVQQYEEKIRPQAAGAVNEISSIHGFRQLLDAGAFTGVGAESKLQLAKVGEMLGVPSEKATNTQALMGAAAERVLGAIKSLGANPSDADRVYLEKAKGGNITFTEAGLRRVLDIGERYARDTIKKHGEEVGRIRRLDGIKDLPEEFFSLSDAPDYQTWSRSNPLAPVTPAPPTNRPPLSSFGTQPSMTVAPPGSMQPRPPLGSFGAPR